jgi:tetratricopeptide (TPR) repeat protein
MKAHGHNDPAIELFRRAARFDSEHNENLGLAIWALGETLRSMDRYDEAIATYRWARELPRAGPDDLLKADDEIALTEVHHRSHAARAAILAALGKGKDDPPPDAQYKLRLRAQSLDWLKTELASLAKALESEPGQNKFKLIRTLEHWKNAPDFAGVREPNDLAKLPEDERKNWQTLWADVARLLTAVTGKAG